MTLLKVIVLSRLLGKLFKDLIQTVTSLLMFLEILKKKALKMTSQMAIDWSFSEPFFTGHFQSFFSSPPILNLIFPANQLIKISGLITFYVVVTF